MDYTNPPITEVICEFRFTPDTEWDITVPGLMYSDIKDTFPKKDNRVIQNVEIPSQGSDKKEVVVQQSNRAVFLTEDGNTQIQIASRLLAITRLKPYTTWEDFNANVEHAHSKLSKNVDIRGVQRIGLRYINQIEIPLSSVDLEDYFEFRPELGRRLSTTSLVEFIIGCVQPYADGRDLCRIQLRSAIPTSPDSVAFTLDLDYFLAKSGEIMPDQALSWVDDAHRKIDEIFEGCIKEPLREIFR